MDPGSPESVDTAPDARYFSVWMKKHFKHIKHKPLAHLTLPGTHDSAAHQINFKHSEFKTFRDKLLNRVVPFLPPVRRAITKLTVTQNLHIKDQLRAGIRFLDLRLQWMHRKEQLFLSHTIACISLEQALIDVRDFLRHHKYEVVVLYLQLDHHHKHTFTQAAFEAKQKLIHDVLGDTVWDQQFTEHHPTLKHLKQTNKRVVLVHNASMRPLVQSNSYPNYVPNRRIWPNKQVARDVAPYIVQSVRPHRKHLQVLDCVLTPKATQVVGSGIKSALYIPVKESLEGFAEQMNEALPSIVEQLSEKDTMQYVFALAMDFPSPETIELIINLNKQEQV